MDLRTTPRVELSSGPVVMGDRPGGQSGLEVLWSVDGPLIFGSSNRYYFDDARTLTTFRATLPTPGATATVLSIRKNGVQQTTVTVGAGVETVEQAVSVAYAAGDYYTAAITTVGTGAEDLQTQAFWP